MTGDKATSDGKQGKSQGRRFHGRRPDEERRINIPMLKYGKGVKGLWRPSETINAKQVLHT